MHLLALFGWSWNVHLTWDPQIRGMLFVGIAASMLIGSVLLLLSTNVGFRMGLAITLTGLFGWLTILTGTWTVYALKQGPPNPSAVEAKWIVKEIVTGNIADQAGYPPTEDFSKTKGTAKAWGELPKTDKDFADAAAATDNALAPSQIISNEKFPPKPPPKSFTGDTPFSATTQYQLVHVYASGGETYWPLGAGVRSLHDERNKAVSEVNCATTPMAKGCQNPKVEKVDCSDGSGTTCVQTKFHWWQRGYYRVTKGFLHKPHYVVVQVQPVKDANALKPEIDPSKPKTTIVMVRKLGQQRVYPAMWFISNGICFALFATALHRRDKRVMAQRAAMAT